MCDISMHPWVFDGNEIWCPDCKKKFTASVDWIEFVLTEKLHALEAYQSLVEKATDAYLSRTLLCLQ